MDSESLIPFTLMGRTLRIFSDNQKTQEGYILLTHIYWHKETDIYRPNNAINFSITTAPLLPSQIVAQKSGKWRHRSTVFNHLEATTNYLSNELQHNVLSF